MKLHDFPPHCPDVRRSKRSDELALTARLSPARKTASCDLWRAAFGAGAIGGCVVESCRMAGLARVDGVVSWD